MKFIGDCRAFWARSADGGFGKSQVACARPARLARSLLQIAGGYAGAGGASDL